MNFERAEAKARLIVGQAMAMHTEMVAAGEVEESSDPVVMFRRGGGGMGIGVITMRNKHLNKEHRKNFEQEEPEVRLIVEKPERLEAEVAGFIADKALVTNTEMVAAGKVEESSDPLVMFGAPGVAHAVGVMMIIREEYNIDAEEEAVRAANN